MAEPLLNLFLIDEDPVFRLGLRIWLDQRPEFQVVGEASTTEAALQQLSTLQTMAADTAADAGALPSASVDMVILDLGLGQGDPEKLPGLELCAAIKRQFPTLPVLVLSAQDEAILRAAAQHMGADGFGQRGLPVRELARLIQHVAARQDNLSDVTQDVSLPEPTEGPIAFLHMSSLRQIEAAMQGIEEQANQRLPYWYRLVLAGKYRELRAARWLIQRVLPLPEAPSVSVSSGSSSVTNIANSQLTSNRVTPAGGAIAHAASPLPVVIDDVRTRVCEAVFRKLQFPLDNRSDIPLEIDILRSDKSRELLYTTLSTFESLLDDLQQAQIPPGQLATRAPDFVLDLWKTVTLDFFGRYYTPPIDGLEQPMVAMLQQDRAIVEAAILSRIPEVSTLLDHLLFQASLDIDGSAYVATTPEALRRSQFLLEHLLIQVACAVMQPVLNRFSEVEILKRTLYQRRILSTRDITRFRNDLSWRYRWDTLVHEPKAIFESHYRLFALTPQGIQIHTIYAPRQTELAALTGTQYMMTLALEARDAIAPRLRSALSFAGSGVVFVLTEVVGRGIGLVGRGIFKGIGSAWQDNRLRQRQREDL
ncbi:MAG: DUF3685 domain-containing protein [Cyanobacteria bacterium J06639_14]